MPTNGGDHKEKKRPDMVHQRTHTRVTSTVRSTSRYRLPRNRPITIICPKCRTKINQTLGALERQSRFTCPSCRCVIEHEGFSSAIKETEHMLHKFLDTRR